MQFTKAEAYGLHGIIFLAEQPEGTITPLSAVSGAQQVPEKFLAKIFQGLTKAGLVNSHRGVKGGFLMAKPPAEITVREVLEAIRGPYSVAKCLAGEEECDKAETCSIRKLMQLTQERLLDLLEEHTVADLVEWEREISSRSAHSEE
jgi:Rrf2 family protein